MQATAAANDTFKLTRTQALIILTAVLASLLEIIDTSIVNVAVPSMMGNLGATLEDISWVITGYIIANAIVLPIAGWLGMQMGRRQYYIGCILFFTGASVACGLAPNLPSLVAFRILQGLAGGALLPTSQALIREQFPASKAGMASAIYGMGVIIGPTIGPTLGGYLTDHLGWRAIFNINLPLGLLAAAMAYMTIEEFGVTREQRLANEAARKENPNALPTTPPRTRTPIDFYGLILLALGIGCLQFVLERGEADDWFESKIIIAATLIAVISIPSFIWWELKTKFPIIEIRLFKHAAVRTGTALMLALGLMLYATIFILPIFVSTVLNYDATQTGMLFIPGALITAMLMPIVGRLLKTVDARFLILWGVVVVEVFLFMMTSFSSNTTNRDLFWPLFVRGWGMAFLFVPINAVSLGEFKGPALGQVAGLMNLSRQVGGSIGIAALSTLLSKYNAKNYYLLSTHVSLLDSNTYYSMRQIQAGMTGRMMTALGGGTAQQAALKSLSFRIQKQVFCLSFTQLMWLLFACFGMALIPLFLMKPHKPDPNAEAVDAH